MSQAFELVSLRLFISAGSSTPTLLGTLTAGQNYTFSVTGAAALCGIPLSFKLPPQPGSDAVPLSQAA